MIGFVELRGNAANSLTGERIIPGNRKEDRFVDEYLGSNW